MQSTETTIYLNVYDITAFESDMMKSVLVNLNYFTRNLVGLGGIFHGAIELFNEEVSYGYCDSGTGVYLCKAR